MLEKIKYVLSQGFARRRTRVSCLAALSVITVAAATLLVFSVKTIKVFDGEQTYTVHSLNGNVASVLQNLDLKSEHYRIQKTFVKEKSTHVEIVYTFPVYITSGDKTTEVEFTKGTVSDALKLAGITADEYDYIEPAADAEITETVYIDYTDINYVDGSYTETVPRATETVYSASVEKGKTTVKEGSDGLKLVSFKEKLVNGVVEEKTVTGSKMLKNPVNTIKTVGTKVTTVKTVLTSNLIKCISVLNPSKPIELNKSATPLKYKLKMTVRATAYTYTGHNCATGVAPKPGYIAVNPKVIPYGTKMFIKSSDGKFIYGYAIAADTGGFVKNHPTGVDLFMTTQSACSSFGVRNVEIYILE